MRAERNDEITVGSGNVFADVGLPNPEEALAKAKLVHALSRAIAEAELDHASAGKALGIEPDVLALLLRGRTEGFSFDRLVGLLNHMGHRVEITVLPKVA